MRLFRVFSASYHFGFLLFIAIPEEEIIGINFKPLIIFVPLAVAYGRFLDILKVRQKCNDVCIIDKIELFNQKALFMVGMTLAGGTIY